MKRLCSILILAVIALVPTIRPATAADRDDRADRERRIVIPAHVANPGAGIFFVPPALAAAVGSEILLQLYEEKIIEVTYSSPGGASVDDSPNLPAANNLPYGSPLSGNAQVVTNFSFGSFILGHDEATTTITPAISTVVHDHELGE